MEGAGDSVVSDGVADDGMAAIGVATDAVAGKGGQHGVAYGSVPYVGMVSLGIREISNNLLKTKLKQYGNGKWNI